MGFPLGEPHSDQVQTPASSRSGRDTWGWHLRSPGTPWHGEAPSGAPHFHPVLRRAAVNPGCTCHPQCPGPWALCKYQLPTGYSSGNPGQFWHVSRHYSSLPSPLTTATSEVLREIPVSPFGAMVRPMLMGGSPLPHRAPRSMGPFLRVLSGVPLTGPGLPFADASPSRRETPLMGYSGSHTRPAGVHLPTRRSDPQDSPSLAPLVSLRDMIALLLSRQERDRLCCRMVTWTPPDWVPSR
ncbi:hypothetical protein ACOMHN_050084 [Nucella lapillus]